MTTEPVTQRFEFVIGVNPGYQHDNEVEQPLAIVAKAWRRAAKQCERDGGMFISAVFTQGKCIWPDGEDRKCPETGEDVVIVSGVRNSTRCRYPARWRKSLNWICAEVQRRLNQTTSTLAVHEVQFRYNIGC